MHKKSLIILVASLMLFACVHTAAADSLAGEWQGSASISALPFSLSATVKFNDDNTFSLRLTTLFGIVCFEGSGVYSVGSNAITITPASFGGLFASQVASPERIGTVSIPYTFWDSRLHIGGQALGLDGTISLSRK